MKKFKPVICGFCIVLSVVLFILCFYIIKTKINEKKKFAFVKNDFEICNEFFLNLCLNNDKTTFDISYDDDDISSITMFNNNDLQGINVPLKNEIKKSLLNIRNKAFVGGFDSVFVESSRISYGGMSNRLYVYSKNGKRPSYFYSPSQKHKFLYSVYRLGNNWFLLKS